MQIGVSYVLFDWEFEIEAFTHVEMYKFCLFRICSMLLGNEINYINVNIVYKPQQVLTKHYKSIKLAPFLYYFYAITIQLNKFNQKSYYYYSKSLHFESNRVSINNQITTISM